MKVRIEQIYDCDTKNYLEQFFNVDSRSDREVNGAGAVSFSVLKSHCDDKVWSHVAEAVHPVNAAAPVRKIFGETTRMEEHATWRLGTNTIELSYVPEKMKDKISCRGQIQANSTSDGKTRITMDLDINVKIFGVGGLVEKLVAKECPDAFAKDCEYFNKNK